MAIRDSQDVSLPITRPTSAKIRDSQDVVIPIKLPTSTKIRDSQDVVLAITGNNLLLKVHVKRYIVTRRRKPKNKHHWGHFQSAALLSAALYAPIIEKGVEIQRHAVHVHHARRRPIMMNGALRHGAPRRTVQPFVFVSC